MFEASADGCSAQLELPLILMRQIAAPIVVVMRVMLVCLVTWNFLRSRSLRIRRVDEKARGEVLTSATVSSDWRVLVDSHTVAWVFLESLARAAASFCRVS